MSQQELLKRVVEALRGAGIDFMITGSIASSLQGEPRSTHDLDVVVEIREEDVEPLLSAFPHPDFYADEEAARDAVRSGSMFNVLDMGEGAKVDFWLLTEEPFDRSRFARKIVEDVFGIMLNVSAPEDTILAKLRWSKLSGGSEKQYTDALRVYEVQAGTLDSEYLEEWAHRLGVSAAWERIRAEAEQV